MSPRPRATSLEERIGAWLATIASPNTRAAYGRDLALFAEWLARTGQRVDTVDRPVVEAFARECIRRGDGPATRNRRLSAVASFFRFEAGSRPAARGSARTAAPDPTAGVRRAATPARDEARLDASQAAALWEAAQQLGPKTAVLVALTLLEGLPARDILALDVEHVRITRTAVVIHRPSGRGTDVPHVVDTRTADALRAHLAGRQTGPLLQGDNPTRAPARLSRFGVDYLVKRVGTEAGLDLVVTTTLLRRSALGN